MEYQLILNAIISIIVAVGLYVLVHVIVRKKLSDLRGAQKIVNLVLLVIIIIEVAFLGLLFGVFDIASEVIASMGLAFALVTFALFNHLKNLVAGIGLYLNPEINVGDIIEVRGYTGTIVEITLMKTIALTNEGKRIIIPNLTFSEEVTILTHGRKQNKSVGERA